MSRRVVMGAANYWGSPIMTGTQHYAVQLARAEWAVAYLSDQISPLHLVRLKSRAYTLDKFSIWARGGVRAGDGGRIFAYNHLTLLPVFDAPILRSGFAARRSLGLSIPNVYRKLDRVGFSEVDLVWLDHLLFTDLLDRFPGARSVYRMADDPRLFPEANPPSMLKRVDLLLERAELVVVTARRLYEQVASARTGNVLYLPNGVDYDHFARSGMPVPWDYGRIPEPRAIYAGSLESWFDLDLVEAAATARPEVSFVIIGPARIDLGRLRRLANVHLLGKRSYAELPAYLAHASVGIIPFRVSEHIEAVNPIKLYEYLAAGLPVVAPRWHELEQMSSPALLADGVSEFVDALDTAIAAPGAAAELRAFARANSWAARFRLVADALGLSDTSPAGPCASS